MSFLKVSGASSYRGLAEAGWQNGGAPWWTRISFHGMSFLGCAGGSGQAGTGRLEEQFKHYLAGKCSKRSLLISDISASIITRSQDRAHLMVKKPKVFKATQLSYEDFCF